VAVVLVKGWYSFERLMLLVLVVMYFVGFKQIHEEGKVRRDQTCVIFERKHKTDVEKLTRTYDYLQRQPDSAFRDPTSLPNEVIRSLSTTEAEARMDDAPPFCDDEGIGLPEPDPVVPPRPLKFR
jgi:hypothetical protein